MLDAGGRFIALTDKGNWLRARIVMRDGRPIAIADAELAPILGPDGTAGRLAAQLVRHGSVGG